MACVLLEVFILKPDCCCLLRKEDASETSKMAADPVKNSSMEESSIPRKDIDVESSNGETAVIAETARVLDHAAEVKLTRKFDLRILPILAVMCKSTPRRNCVSSWRVRL